MLFVIKRACTLTHEPYIVGKESYILTKEL